eukprot:scaffold873_cov252-Pinguiococcus_pyrenoidosus.AAC.10
MDSESCVGGGCLEAEEASSLGLFRSKLLSRVRGRHPMGAATLNATCSCSWRELWPSFWGLFLRPKMAFFPRRSVKIRFR